MIMMLSNFIEILSFLVKKMILCTFSDMPSPLFFSFDACSIGLGQIFKNERARELFCDILVHP